VVEDTVSVGSYPNGASLYGVMDMAGNVLEWFADGHQGDYYGFSPPGNPLESEDGTHKILRGGAGTTWD